MKRHRSHVVFVLILLLAAVFATAVAAQTPGPRLAISEIAAEPTPIRVGAETLFIVTYGNEGDAAVPPETTADVHLTVTDLRNEEKLADCRAEVDVAALAPGETARVPLTACPVIFLEENAHRVQATITDLSGTAATADGGRTLTVNPAPYQSNLPADLGQVFAGLGIFIAVMAIVAVGTEVVIDTFKVAAGLKSKVTAGEALDRMARYMPGELATLGVNAAAQHQFRALAEEMKSTLASTLEPVRTLGEMRQQLVDGRYGAAYAEIEKLLPAQGAIAQQNLARFRQQVTLYVDRVLADVEQTFHVNAKMMERLRQLVHEKIAAFDGQNPGDFLEELFAALQDLHFWATQIADGWLAQQTDLFVAQGSGEVLRRFDEDVTPLLLSLGLADASVTAVRHSLETQLRIIGTGVERASGAFITSMRNVLDAVELRRYETQSPLRKIWRLLRRWRSGQWTRWSLYGLYGVLALALLLGLFGLMLTWLLLPQPQSVGAAVRLQILPGWLWVLLYVIYVAVLFGLTLLIGQIGKAVYARRVEKSAEPAAVKQRYKSTLTNATVLLRVETLFNLIRAGFEFEKVDPNAFDKPASVAKYEQELQLHLDEETAAQFILARTDQQRDEEESRLRWLRVISFVIGLLIGYLLQIDALRLLGEAFPGVIEGLNFTVLSGEQLNTWRPWLSPDKAITVGIILTAFAASAGSAFWHDRLDQLQATKKATETAAKLLSEAQQTVDTTFERNGRR